MSRPDLLLAFAIAVATDPFAFALLVGVRERPRPRSAISCLGIARHTGNDQLVISLRGSCAGRSVEGQWMQSSALNANVAASA